MPLVQWDLPCRIVSAPPLIGLKVLIGYIGTTGHKCDEALFELKMNGVSLGIANLNNGKYDTSGFTKNIVLTDPMLAVKKLIKTHNDKMYSKMINAERRKYTNWRTSTPETSYKEYVFVASETEGHP